MASSAGSFQADVQKSQRKNVLGKVEEKPCDWSGVNVGKSEGKGSSRRRHSRDGQELGHQTDKGNRICVLPEPSLFFLGMVIDSDHLSALFWL